MQSTSHVESINGVIKKKLNGRSVTLFEVCKTITQFLQERQINQEVRMCIYCFISNIQNLTIIFLQFIAWKESTPLISPPNIYNTIFFDIDLELRTFVTLPIIDKIHEQMNHSFLYHATKSNNEMALQKDKEVDCETACSDEVFDLPQVRVRTIVHEF